jgi:hypothetical protein
MSGRHRTRAVLAVAAALLCGTPLTRLQAAARADVPANDTVQVSVLDVNPTTPAAGPTPQPLVVTLKLTNTTDRALPDLTVVGTRGNPISNQHSLDAAISSVQPPDESLAGRFAATTPVKASLGPLASRTVSYASTTSMAGVQAGLCICQTRIYPLYFAVHQTGTDGADSVLGSTQTFIPAFAPDQRVAPTEVSWVWPILEPPHRSLSDDVFADDRLAGSIAPGGRLDRLLQVVQNVGNSVPLTLLVDPNLLDELAIMAAGPYRVAAAGAGSDAGSKTVPGTGTAAAKAWLARFSTALAAAPNLQLSFTPYADPDVDSLARNGLDWATQLPPDAQARVSALLGGRSASTGLAWPVHSTLGAAALTALVRNGTDTVIVDDHTLPGGTGGSPLPNALGRLRSSAGPATMAVTSSTVEQFVAAVVGNGANGTALLPQLVSEVAVRAVEDGSRSHYVLITPPRDVDPDPAAATRAIRETASTAWSRALSLQAATHSVRPVGHGRLADQSNSGGLPTSTVNTARYAATAVPTLTGLIPDAKQAADSFGSVEAAVQRSESSAWRDSPQRSAQIATAIRSRLSKLLDGVHLVRPSTGSYTFGSADSPLPVTISNTLDVTVSVRLAIGTVGGVLGFSADDVGAQTIAPHSKLPLHVPAHIDPVRRIKVNVQLLNGDGDVVGSPLVLSVRSTALGTIGKIITFGAAAVLAAALLLRGARRLRHRRKAAGRAR